MRIAVVAANSRSLVSNRGHLVREWLEFGHKVSAFVPAEDLSPGDLTSLPIPITPIQLKRHGATPASALLELRGLRKKLTRGKFDLVFAYTLRVCISSGLALFGRRQPRLGCLVTGLGTGHSTIAATDFKGALARKVLGTALGRSDPVIFQNHDDQALVGKLLSMNSAGKGSHVVPGSGVSTEDFPVEPFDPASQTFLMLSRLLESKGVIRYAAMARALKARFPEARFLLAGKYEAEIRDAVEPWEIVEASGGAVEYLGMVADVRPLLREARAFILPTTYREGLPRSILEAMATGRAVIASDWPGCREAVVDGETGFLIPPHSTDELIRRGHEILESDELAASMGEAGRSRVEACFSVDIVNSLMSKYLRVPLDLPARTPDA